MKILISRPDKIGDVVLSLHAVKQLKTHLPEAEVYLHVSSITKPLVEMVRFVDGVVDFEEDLRPYAFDAVVDLMAKSRTSRIYAEAEIPLRVGNAARWFRYRFNRPIMIRRSRALMNEAEYNWQMIRMLDERLHHANITLSLSTSDLDFEPAPYDGKPYVLLMPGVTVSARPWDPSLWIELAKELIASGKPAVKIILGPAESDQEVMYNKAFQDNDEIEIVCTSDFRSLFQILASAESYVGTSTGVTHLASVFQIPGVALYPEQRSLHPRRWQPFQSSLKVLSLDRGVRAKDVCDALYDRGSLEKEPLARESVTGFVVCYNEEDNIRRCLESLKWCDEILVVDSGSTDQTLEICKEYTENIIHQPWLGYSKQKQFALTKCTNDWVVNIDSDEEISFELRNKIQYLLCYSTPKDEEVNGYAISRIVYYLNHWWDKGGWYPEYRLRFFRRSVARWGGIDPHEKAEIDGPVKKLQESIYHYTYDDMDDQIRCLAAHASLSAKGMYEKGMRSSLVKIFFRPLFRFFKFYVLKGGFRHGYVGFVVGCVESFGTLFKYVRLWEIQKCPDSQKNFT